jgi:hypothetical protein
VGASLDKDLKLAPFAGLGFARIFSKVSVGGSLDLSGTGFFADYEVADHLVLGASWRLIVFHDNATRLALNLAYRF